ncbi:hypothetical protein [Acidianus bottle-shaped virus 3 strain ABV3]|uniref:Uncharacterized protein n=1 Tax=Acidianus bottle-shaped virus 3 strain ABV3 TaxID=1732174 RepID=A0A0N9NY04_9VIRU|nr:hypothetical protein AVU00_gp41 [Acidianus bottle-shaped virus 3 strain ABV3]ALG96843.1 hypothetical protein [Acidianus bottle-shaped virus 3 strain ABV3]
MFERIIKKFPFTKPLIKKLSEIYETATPKERKVINNFLEVFYNALIVVPKKEKFYKKILSDLKKGKSLKEIAEEIKRELKAEETSDVDEIVDKLIDYCDRKMTKRVIETLLSLIPDDKQEKILSKIKEMIKNEH